MHLQSRLRIFERALAYGGVGSLVFLLAGCAIWKIPAQMQVRSGVDPRYQDDDVLFRTTYYFRVFDFCGEKNDSVKNRGYESIHSETPPRQEPQVLSDSLYRFTMTGKGSSFFSKVHFESGTLKSYEIDPFGATVVYDEASKSFRIKSRQEREDETRRGEQFREIERYLAMYHEFKKESELEGVANQVKAILGSLVSGISGRTPGEKGDEAQEKGGSALAGCPGGAAKRRGFQIFGPEGWKTFDQDERVVMAMSSSAKPLIGAMREVSARVLNEQQTPAEVLLPLVRERLRTSLAEREIDHLRVILAAQAADGSSTSLPGTDQLWRAIVEVFEGKKQSP